MSKYKPKSCVWDYFQKIDDKSKCNYCNKIISGSATRLKEHLLYKCKEVPESVINIINKEYRKGILEDRPGSSMSSHSNSSVLSFVDLMTNTEREQIDSLISKLIFRANLPFQLVENEDFKNLIKKLKPSYPGLSRKVLSDRHLETEYLKVKTVTEKAIKESMGITIQMDGWSNINRNSIINVIVCTPKPYYIKSYNTGGQSHTSSYLFKLIDEQIENLGPDKVVAIITDNANNMALMRQHIQNKYPKIQEFGCAAHGLNLLTSDICNMESFKVFISEIESVVKEITQSNIKSSKFNEISNKEVKRLVLRNKTRWYTTVAMLESVSSAKDVLGKMAFDNSLDNSKDLILEKKKLFWQPLDNFIKLLKPISKAIGLIESDKAVISDLPFILNELFAEITTTVELFFTSNREEIFGILQNRRDFMETSFHFFANIIDPRYKGKSLSNAQRDIGFEFFDEYMKVLNLGIEETKVLTSFQNFRTKSGPFKHDFLYKESYIQNPYLWWKGFLDFEDEKELAQIAVKIFTVPTSSAASERSFSNEGRIHTKLRNRLSDASVERLLYIQFNSSSEPVCFEVSDSDQEDISNDVEIIE